MREMIVSIKGLNDIYNFIANAQKVDGDIIVRRGRYIIDVKSILGIFSLDMSQNITVTYPETASDFEEFIQQFKVNR